MAFFTVFHGTLIHSLSLTQLEIINDGLLVVDQQGVIVQLERDVKDVEVIVSSLSGSCKVHRLEPHQFLLPGFVDTHAHAPQFVFAGSGMDLPLLEWLNTYVFHVESKFQLAEYAERCYTKVVSRFLKNGTTTCSWFATIHLQACQILVDVVERLGQRAYVGKVNMDQNSPDYYIESTEASLRDSRAFIEYTQNKSSLVTPVITPRFAITCSSELMKGLAALAKEYDVPIQTHLCETLNEIDFTLSLFPDSKNYTAVYDDHGLLNDKAYMAHCVHMKDEEIALLAERNTGVSHCANSNFSLHSGVCDVRRFIDKGLKVGLGTDVAGGFSPSILDAVRSSFIASKTVKIMQQENKSRIGEKEYTPLNPAELLYLATLGGAKVLGLQDTIGNFAVGKSFDALWVDLAEDGPVDLIGHETKQQMLEKFLFIGNDQALLHIFVQGRRVAGKAATTTISA
ncbi:hypothetical protein DFQ28_011195 [Apophysomyces sp. BC1034]|nr:hypothetical protein DFQ30_011236 [Apophysomyces sp. BC1015]KAG0169190.1 hypothetical protein DFQ29_009798 [Apophysomyces sp. BC1021]KAG0184403.1 hypothetical protein DFQ28_011195 [Apophysomyces sp. BC1034]